jgi:hypothetical protein
LSGIYNCTIAHFSSFPKMVASSRLLVGVLASFLTVNLAPVLPTVAAFAGSVHNKANSRFTKAFRMIPAQECATAAVMAGLGDVLAQTNSAKETTFDFSRTYQFMFKGLVEGLMWSIWYRVADQWTTSMIQSFMAHGFNSIGPRLEGVLRTVFSLLLELAIASPLIFGLWDIPFVALCSGVPAREIPYQIKVKLGEMLFASIRVWTPVNVVIYNSPLEYRVLLLSVVDVFWQSIVSTIATRDVPRNDALDNLQVG